MDTALFLHDLTDRTPHKFHMAFPYGYNTSSPKAAGILCSCKKEPYYSLGIALVDTPAGNTVRAYNAEKTLCEILKPISHTDIQIITDAFKRYAGRKDKNIPLLSEYQQTRRRLTLDLKPGSGSSNLQTSAKIQRIKICTRPLRRLRPRR